MYTIMYTSVGGNTVVKASGMLSTLFLIRIPECGMKIFKYFLRNCCWVHITFDIFYKGLGILFSLFQRSDFV